METISLRVCICQFRVNLGLPEGLASHLKEPHKVVMFARVVSNFDDLREVGWVFRLDVRVYVITLVEFTG
jgi:hypothetical protein